MARSFVKGHANVKSDSKDFSQTSLPYGQKKLFEKDVVSKDSSMALIV